MRRTLILVSAVAFALAILGATMSKAADRYICSPMQGVLVGADGAPAAGITVRRMWNYNDRTENETVTTDAQGRFAFDGVPAPRKRWFSGLSTPVVLQRYYAALPGGEEEILYINSGSLDPLHETGGAPFSVTCDLRETPGNGPLGWGYCSLNK